MDFGQPLENVGLYGWNLEEETQTSLVIAKPLMQDNP
jgi:hypothetical protein